MTVKPNTWHYRLASFYGQGDYYRRTNLCSYFWHFMFGVVLCAFIACVSAFLLYFILMGPVFWIVLCVADWHLYRPLEEAMIGLMLWGIATVGLSFVFYATYREAGNQPFLPIPDPVREAYRGWKEKYCPIVEIAE